MGFGAVRHRHAVSVTAPAGSPGKAPCLFIDGAAGTTGLDLARRAGEAGFRLIELPAAHRKDASARQDAMAQAAIAVLCLPDDAARQAAELAAGLGPDAPRLLDASSAHRTAAGWVYGFPELAAGQDRAIAQAARVSNPGCYATGAIALLRPLTDAGLLPADYPISIHAVSGTSGGGHAMIAAHEATGGPAFELYALGLAHKHLPEIIRHAGLSRAPVFVPSVGHFRQGMLVSIGLHTDTLPGRPDAAAIAACLRARYETGQVRVQDGDPADRLAADSLAGSDAMILRVYGEADRVLLVACLDNLGKGAAGAAMQSLRLMLEEA